MWKVQENGTSKHNKIIEIFSSDLFESNRLLYDMKNIKLLWRGNEFVRRFIQGNNCGGPSFA